MEIRPLDELEPYVAVHNAVHPEDPVAVEDIRSWVDALRDHAFLSAEEQGVTAGVASVALEPGRATPVVRILVLPDHRRHGIGAALYGAVSRWAAERGHEELEAWVRRTQPQSLDFARKRGFVEIGREQGLELDLTAFDPPPVDPPEGIEITTWAERPELARGLYEVAVEAYRDIPGEEDGEMETFEDWLAHDMGGAGDKPEATFVALAGHEVVGYSKFALTGAQPAVAHHDLTGVKRAWRGRGIAGALKRAQIAWAKANGYERLVTRNEERNVPIRKLNERLGYRPAPGAVLFRGPLSG